MEQQDLTLDENMYYIRFSFTISSHNNDNDPGAKYANNFSPVPFSTELVLSLTEIIDCLKTSLLKCTIW